MPICASCVGSSRGLWISSMDGLCFNHIYDVNDSFIWKFLSENVPKEKTETIERRKWKSSKWKSSKWKIIERGLENTPKVNGLNTMAIGYT